VELGPTVGLGELPALQAPSTRALIVVATRARASELARGAPSSKWYIVRTPVRAGLRLLPRCRLEQSVGRMTKVA
jgi:hypothetical protein